MPRGLAAAAAGHVIGAQANVWTERIATPDHLFSMTLPRELALAENAWTPRARKSWPSFLARLPAQFAWLEAHGYPFRIPNVAFALWAGARPSTKPFPATCRRCARGSSHPRRDGSVERAGARRRHPVYDGRFGADRVDRRSTAVRSPISVGSVPVVLRATAFVHGRAGAVSECAVGRITVEALRAHRNAATSWSALVSP